MIMKHISVLDSFKVDIADGYPVMVFPFYFLSQTHLLLNATKKMNLILAIFGGLCFNFQRTCFTVAVIKTLCKICSS